MVRKPLKLLIMAACSLGLTLGLFSCSRHYLNQDKIVHLAEQQLEKTFHQPASMGSARLEIFKGPRITLKNVTIGAPGKLYIRAARVRVKLRPAQLLLGRVELRRIDLLSPVAWLSATDLRELSRSSGRRQPRIKVIDGSLNLAWRGSIYDLSETNGDFSRHRCEFDARAMGGTVTIKIKRVRKLWQGSVKLSGIRPATPQLRAYLPLDLELHGHGTDKRAVLSSIKLASPLVALDGSGRLEKLKHDYRVKLELDSTSFDYQRLIDPFPIKGSFLNRLFKVYIRDGRGRLEHLRLNGRLSELKKPARFFELLDLELALGAQSFGAAFDKERIRDIQGRFMIKNGDVRFEGLSGKIGKSSLERVDLFFQAPLKPGLRLKADVATAMQAADFVRAWRAVMVYRPLYDAFAGFTRVADGQVRGQVKTSYDSRRAAKPFQISGQLDFERISLVWNGLDFKQVSGRAVAARPLDPIVFDLAGGFEGARLPSFRLSLSEFSANSPYAFNVQAEQLPVVGGLQLDDKALLKLAGQGRGPRFSGTAQLEASRLSRKTASLTSTAGRRLTAVGGIEGSLWPDFALKLKQVRLVGSGLSLNGGFDLRRGRLDLTGQLNLAEFPLMLDRELGAARGRLASDLTVAWGGPEQLTGTLELEQVRLASRAQSCVLDGGLRLAPNEISSPKLRITTPETALTLKASLNPARKLLSGAGEVRGFSLGTARKNPGLALPAGYRARLDLSLADLDLYGLRMRQGTARLDYAGGNLKLNNLRLSGSDGSLRGKVQINRRQEYSYDLVAAIKGADIGGLIANFSHKKPLARGRADLDGHFWGSGKSMNGKARFVINNGKVLRYGVLAKVFGTLNVYKMFKNNSLAIREDGFPFNRFSGSFLLRNNLASFDDLRLDSNSVQLSAVGSYDFNTEVISAILGIQPLETVDRTIGAIPVVGWILTGPESKLLVFSVRVKGPIDDPLVLPAPIDTLSKPVIGAIQRTLMLPVDLIRTPHRVLLPGGTEPNRQQTEGSERKFLRKR